MIRYATIPGIPNSMRRSVTSVTSISLQVADASQV
jgi:hypothetical protein